ncbi:hypothetical protein [Streptomyces sp. NRRL S-237]|uniref:hypothetical protein n=1 Tax=Streptomyces sp. NRRL S-237 TaxID=1463895 RepID=UPI0004CBD546|nr:hypothetical protein [Streptomyces sp. NRRL S-237]
MPDRTDAVRAACLATTAVMTAALTACGSAEPAPHAGRSAPQPFGSPTAVSEDVQIAAAAEGFMKAWMLDPADVRSMCEHQTKAARPNFTDDGGTVEGCVAERKSLTERTPEPQRAQLRFTVDHVQDVNASRKHPAGKGVLATGQRDGAKPFRYALRLIKEDGRWRVEQREDVRSRYDHTADPVADVLWSMG